MLQEIRIGQLGVIESSTLTLGPGLTVITGETGAGKTMVVTALGLLLGGRADSGMVRTGAGGARVEGVVDASGLDGFGAAVDDAGGEVEDGQVVLARNVSSEGRSRAWIGGASVPVSRLAEVAEPLVAVHGQSDQHRLLRQRAQREALDRFGGQPVLALAAAYAALHARLEATERELDEVVASARERAREADLLRFGLGEIEAVDPKPGEDAQLATDEARLGYADALRTAAEQAREALSSETGDPDALGATSAARTLLEGVREHDPEAGALADRLAEITYLVSDLAADVASYAASVDADPARLAAVSERRAALTALTRKYGETVEEVLAWSETSAARLLDLDGTDERIERLRDEQRSLRAELGEVAQTLSTSRAEAATRLSGEVTAELALLAMPDARLQIVVSQHDALPHDQPPAGDSPPSGSPLRVGKRWLRHTASGVDEVEFLLAANTGSEPRPLHKGASGGELSRVMLALEVALAGTSPVPTFVFDEVDAGVGGTAAVEVGRRLAQLARTAQVLVVTHLPQVAAYADRHVLVEKASDGSVTSSGLTLLDDEARERELSRMLAGLTESDTALAHARELLEVAAPGRALS
jgi:DNA repair protein RecN (Recombination protein N)